MLWFVFCSSSLYIGGFVLDSHSVYNVKTDQKACCYINWFFFFFWLQFLKVFLVLVQGTSLIQRLMSVAYTYDNLAPRYNIFLFL